MAHHKRVKDIWNIIGQSGRPTKSLQNEIPKLSSKRTMNKKMNRGFCISTTHNTPRRKWHIRPTTLEVISHVYSFITKLSKKNFNFLREVIHSNDRIKIRFRGLESTCQVINHRFPSKRRWGVNSPSPRIMHHTKSDRRQNNRQRYPYLHFMSSRSVKLHWKYKSKVSESVSQASTTKISGGQERACHNHVSHLSKKR